MSNTIRIFSEGQTARVVMPDGSELKGFSFSVTTPFNQLPVLHLQTTDFEVVDHSPQQDE